MLRVNFTLSEMRFEVRMQLRAGGIRAFVGGGAVAPGPCLYLVFGPGLRRILPPAEHVPKGAVLCLPIGEDSLTFPLSAPRADLKWNYFKFAFTCLP